MPELPEVETVKNGLSPFMEGQRIKILHLNRACLRTLFQKDLKEKMDGMRINHLSRRAKYILMHMEGDNVLVVHLGMSGSFRIEDKQAQWQKHDHVVFEMEDSQQIIFNDPRRFGMLFYVSEGAFAQHPSFKAMGPEPIGNIFSAPILHDRLKDKKTVIKNALLDQRVVAGLGNIYVCEALHMSHIHPERRSCDISEEETEALVAAIKDVLVRAIQSGGSSLRDHMQVDGKMGYFQHAFAVYGKEGEPCGTCVSVQQKESLIERIVQSGRSSFYCGACQK